MSESLPALFRLSDYQGDWERYLEALYQIFLDEVVNAGLMFQGLPVRVQFRPMTHGKGFGFWHLISEGQGPNEEERTPDLRRCERLRWIAWLIRNVESKNSIRWWENRRGGNTHVVLWLPAHDFAVVLAKRQGYYLLRTAYVVSPHRKKAFEKEWREFWEKG